MAHQAKKPRFRLATFAALGTSLLFASCGDSSLPGGGSTPPPGDPKPGRNPGSNMPPAQVGQTDFTTEEAGGNDNANAGYRRPGLGGASGAAAGALRPDGPHGRVGRRQGAPPGGRLADVEEADIYKVDKNRLFYLNTYRGFMIYDVNDTKNPQRVSRLPVFGYPVEMFVSGNTVYALLRDALYLTQVGDKLQFERHNVSQLVVIDIADIRNPQRDQAPSTSRASCARACPARSRTRSTWSRYTARTYYWGWRQDPNEQKEQATVYCFNVANPADVKLVEELPIFEGGSVNVNENGY